MEILVTNAEEDPVEIDADDWNLTRYRDASRPSEFKITCARCIPIKPFARVVATDGGETLFRGYVQRPKIKNIKQRELNCRGEEDLLLRRHTGRYSFAPSARVLAHAFDSDAPSQTADSYGVSMCPGLIFEANSAIPLHGESITIGTPVYDWFDYGSDSIYRLDRLGLDSRVASSDIYLEGLLLPRVASFAELQATDISCYSDDDSLWIRVDDEGYNHGLGPKAMLCAHNAYDTGVRMGNIATPETYLDGVFQTEFDRILDILIDLAEFHGTIPFFRYGRNYTYFDTLLSYPDNEFYLPEENIQDISQSRATDLKVHALIGRGMGSRDVRQVYTPSNHAWRGIWYQDVLDVNDGFLDSAGRLKSIVDAEYNRRLSDEVFTVKTTDSWPYKPKPGDTVRLALEGEAERALQVASVKTGSASLTEFEIGARKSDIMDAFNAKSSLSQVYTKEYLTQTSDTISGSGDLQSGDTTHGWCAGYESEFTIPDEVRSADWSHRVFLSVTVTADCDPEPMLMKVLINDESNVYTQPRHYLLGDTVTDLDITRLVDYGSETTIKIYVKKKGDWPDHANCTVHPAMTVSYSVTCYRGTSEWVNPTPPEGEGYYTLRPTGQGDITTVPEPTYKPDHWQEVDEETADEDTTYVGAGATTQGVDTYTLTAIPEENEYGDVVSVTVCTRCRHSVGDGAYLSKGVLNVNGTLFYGRQRTLNTSYQTFFDVYNTNPLTEAAWTWGDLRDLQAGVWLYANLYVGGPQARCTQVYVIVNYA